uniref:Uncharacterized protein n=1 Tax=Romanomermis culicivorax TaxID=13658 RepID=A0A915HGX6_ROMCU
MKQMNASTLEQSLDGKLFVGFVYSFVAIIMLTPYCISWYIIKRDKAIYDYAFRLFALNMGCADLELLACMGVFPALGYLLPISIPFYPLFDICSDLLKNPAT